MNLKRWVILGSLSLLLFGFMALASARGAVASDHEKNTRPVTIAFEGGLLAGKIAFANLPLVQEKDSAQAFKGLQPRWVADLDGSGRRMVEASGVFDEDEKVIEEPEAWGEDEELETIADPLEPLNRAFFQFNDKLYFWVLKPVARGYKFVVPEPLRIGVRNVFTNLAMPVRAANCLLQGKFNGFGREVLRFFVNSTAGFLGFADVATSGMHLEGQDEDFGQTLGFLGAGPGLFINWPIFGPSSARDTVGMVGDWFADPLNYLIKGRWENIGVKGGDRVNRTSLSLGDYESLKKSALDPYVAVRDAYFQYRKNKIKK